MATLPDRLAAWAPLGATLMPEGAVFRVWAPGAVAVFVCGAFNDWTPRPPGQLVRDKQGFWAGFVPLVKDGDPYKFHVVGPGSQGFKRDPYARELATEPPYPKSSCVARDPDLFPWRSTGFRPPAFNDLIIYQFHVGTFYGPDRERRVATFLDVLDRLDYLVTLGVNALEPLPVSEYGAPRSLGYDGSDLFAPELAYAVGPAELDVYLAKVNALYARKGRPPLDRAGLAPATHQLKTFIDLCHLFGLAVIFDVVYSHIGGDAPDQDQGLYFFDRDVRGDPNRSLYFTDQDSAGPVFAFWKREVRRFLIDNALYWLEEYHVDGFRYDNAGVIAASSGDGWRFCQDLTSAVRARDPGVIQIAEFWPVDPKVVLDRALGGAGFDAAWHDGLRETIRGVIGRAAAGRDGALDMDAVARQLVPPGWPAAWKAVQYIESHDEVYRQPGRKPRIPALADPTDHRSWAARSRSRVAIGLLLTAPGVPMLFMGQEFLEDKPWSDNPGYYQGSLIDWGSLTATSHPASEHLRCTRALIALRRRQPALRGERTNAFHVHNERRVLAFHRWIERRGRDVVVVASLNEATQRDYGLGFPGVGRWLEVFNSDAYDHGGNPRAVSGNGGSVLASGPGLQGQPASARVVLPANGLIVFARDHGD